MQYENLSSSAVRLAFAVAVCLPLLQAQSAQNPVDQAAAARSRAETRELVALAQAAPPEIAAHLLLRLAESSAVADRALRRDVIEDAFRLASYAKQPYALRALPASDVDTRSGYLSTALRLGVDGLTLKCRAVTSMLRIDSTRAREMLAEIPLPKLEARTCQDELVWDVGVLHPTVEKVVATAYTAKEIAEERHMDLLRRYANVSSPAELTTIIALLTRVRLNQPQLTELVAKVGSAMERLAEDELSCAYYADATVRAVSVLAPSAARAGVSTFPLIKALRSHVIKCLSGTRCAGIIAGTQELLRCVGAFNSRLRRFGGDEIEPIRPDEVTPKGLQAPSRVEAPAGCDGLSGLLERVRQLRANLRGEETAGTSASATDTLQKVLADVESWNDGSACPATLGFHQKCLVFRGLYRIAQTDSERESVLEGFIRTLEASTVQFESPAEWYLHVRDLEALGPVADLQRVAGRMRATKVAACLRIEGPMLRAAGRTR